MCHHYQIIYITHFARLQDKRRFTRNTGRSIPTTYPDPIAGFSIIPPLSTARSRATLLAPPAPPIDTAAWRVQTLRDAASVAPAALIVAFDLGDDDVTAQHAASGAGPARLGRALGVAGRSAAQLAAAASV